MDASAPMPPQLPPLRGPARPLPRRRPGPAARAFTAFEALLATTVLAILSITISSALMAGRQQTSNAQHTLYASMLARSLMEEILRLPYYDSTGHSTLGPAFGQSAGNRATFTTQGNYAGYTDGPTGITDLAGNTLPAQFQGYTRSVSMTSLSLSPTSWGRTVTGLLVTVTVSYNGLTLATEERYIVPK